MAGYVIHLAVGKVYARYNEIEDIASFEKGIIDPDILKEQGLESHYDSKTITPKINKFIEISGIKTSYDEGYLLHLVTDYIFYNRFLPFFDTRLYNDYDILNKIITEKYNVKIPKELQDKAKFKSGELSILNEEDTLDFIEKVGKINFRKMLTEQDFDKSLSMLKIDWKK